jgi:hypothetical protein
MPTMKELFDVLFGTVLAYTVAYPLATFVLLGLGAVVLAVISRNVVALAIVGCGAIVGFALSYLTGTVTGPLLGLWGALWMIAIVFLMFRGSAEAAATSTDD